MLLRFLVLAQIFLVLGCAQYSQEAQEQEPWQRAVVAIQQAETQRVAQQPQVILPQSTAQKAAPQREVQQRQNVNNLQTNSITRTVEGFTLGMEKDAAFSIFASGVKDGSFKLEVPHGKSLYDLYAYDNKISRRHRTLEEFYNDYVLSSNPPGWLHRASMSIYYGGWIVPTLRSSSMDIESFKLSKEFRSSTTQSIRLIFYLSKLFAIEIIPITSSDILIRSLREKYGPPYIHSGSNINTNALNNTILSPNKGESWIDSQTILNASNEIISVSLTYFDRNLNNLIEEDFRAQRDKEQRKRSTLPKNY